MKVIKIGALWCPDCLIMKPRWAEIEKENAWLETEYIDYDDEEEKAKSLMGEIKEIPVFVFFDKDNKVLERLQGVVSKDILLKKINEYKEK